MLNFPLFPVNASTIAGHVDALLFFAVSVAVFFAALIALLIVVFSIRYHYHTKVNRDHPVYSHVPIEIIWTIIPLGIVLVMYFWGARVYIRMRQPPADAIPIYVVGKQWMWKIQHPEGRQEINELHIPVGYPVKLLMTSQDVIHSFFVPAFRVKQDVLPGRYTTEWFQAAQPGEYHLFCAQYCGTSHSAMVGRIVAMMPADYQRWLSAGVAAAVAPTTAAPKGGPAAKTPSPAMVAAGEKLFKEFGCISCHKSDNTGRGPALEGLFGKTVPLEGGKSVVADEAYIRESILQPNAKIVKGYKPIMPTFEGQLEPEEINQLVAYVESLRAK